MNDVTVMIGSVTYTIKAQKAIAKKGIRTGIIKKESAGERGCTYGLQFASKDTMAVVGILKSGGIHYRFESDDPL